MTSPHLLIVNPNTDRRVTAWLAAEARRVAGPALRVEAVNAASGLPALSTPQHVAQAAQAVIEAVRARPEAGAVLIGAFGDPGLADLRRREPSLRVVGLGEAGLCAAAAGGRAFAVVTLGTAMAAPVRARVTDLGLGDCLAGVTILPIPIEQFIAARAAENERVAAAIRHCFEREGAEAVLLGGAPFAGLAAALQPQFGRPVLDGVAAGVAAALRGTHPA